MSGTSHSYEAAKIMAGPSNSRYEVKSNIVTDSPIWNAEVFNEGQTDKGIDKDVSSQDELIVGWSLVQMYGLQVGPGDKTASVRPRKTLPERLASVLMELFDDEYGIIEDISFDDLALALDTHRATVASLLRTFRRQEMIDFTHRQILILDRESLEEIGG